MGGCGVMVGVVGGWEFVGGLWGAVGSGGVVGSRGLWGRGQLRGCAVVVGVMGGCGVPYVYFVPYTFLHVLYVPLSPRVPTWLTCPHLSPSVPVRSCISYVPICPSVSLYVFMSPYVLVFPLSLYVPIRP